MRISHYTTFHFLRYGHFRYVKCFFKKMQLQQNAIKRGQRFKKNTLWVNNLKIPGIKNVKFWRYYFYMNTCIMEIFKSALVYF